MDIDHLKPAQGNLLEMPMTLPMEEKLLPDYFGGAAGYGPAGGDFPHNYPDNPCLTSPSFVSPPPSSGKSPMISFTSSSSSSSYATDRELDDVTCIGQGPMVAPNNNTKAMREMIFRIAAMQPINIDPEAVKQPKRRNVRTSSDPQSVAARHRRERISERIRILQRLVPGGTKMDTASMLDEAIHYVKFLKRQVQSLERAAQANNDVPGGGIALRLGFPLSVADHHDRAGYHGNSNNPASYHQYYHPRVPPSAHAEQSYGDS